MSVPTELGRRLATRRPLPVAAVVLVPAVPGLVLAAGLAAIGPEGWPPYAVLVFVLTWLVVFLVLGELLAFRHHVHEHGILTESSWPYRKRVVPFRTVDPASVRLAGYERADGTWRDSRDRRRREVPGRPTLRIVALPPHAATDLARGRVVWADCDVEPWHHPVTGQGLGSRALEPVEWVLGWPRGHEDDVGWIRDLAARHQSATCVSTHRSRDGVTNEAGPAWRRRSVPLWSAVAGLATLAWFGGAVALTADPDVRSSPSVLALVGVVAVFGAHLWCSRTRFLVSSAAIVIPGLLLFVAPSFAERGQDQVANGIVVTCAIVVALTTALLTWWGNRRGPSGPIGGLWRLG